MEMKRLAVNIEISSSRLMTDNGIQVKKCSIVALIASSKTTEKNAELMSLMTV